jgi:hypothetical protein
VANKISLIQQAARQDITKLFSTSTNVSTLVDTVNTATQNALNLKAPLSSPNFTGVLNISSTMSLYNKGYNGIVQHPTSLRFSIGSTMTSPLIMDSLTVYLMYPTLHYQPATFYSDVSFEGGNVTGLVSSMVGLSNVANTKPSDLPVSTATQSAINAVNKTSLGLGNVANTAPSYFATAASVTALNKASVGLGNVANTSPTDLPVSTATQSALDVKASLNNPNMTGALNISSTMALYNKGIYGIVQHPTSLRFSIGSTMTSPLLMDNVNVYLMYPSLHYQPATFYSDVNFSGGVVTGLTSDMVGLSNVANTAPSYFASASSLASYAPLAAPALTGMVTVDN